MLQEPCAGQPGDHLQGTRLLEEMGGTRNDLELLLAAQESKGCTIQRQYLGVPATDDKQGRGKDGGKRVPGKIGTSATRDNGLNGLRASRRCNEGGGCARACAEQADRLPAVGGHGVESVRCASSEMSNTLTRLSASSDVSRLNSRVPSPLR